MKLLLAIILLTSISFSQTSTPLEKRMRRAEICKNSHLSKCHRCGLDCGQTNFHDTRTSYKVNAGYFGYSALCEDCWKELTPEQRLVFYEISWIENKIEVKYCPECFPDAKWAAIKDAVLKGG